MAFIFHITSKEDWSKAQGEKVYKASSLETEGFIHLSKADQVADTGNRFYQGIENLVLLFVDPDKLEQPLKYEEGEPNILFPHLYGPLNLEAVIKVIDFKPNSQGKYEFSGD